jgi:hypothetical protein
MPKKNINTDLLDSLAKDLGEVVKKEEKDYVVLEGEQRDKYVDESLTGITEKPSLAYSEGVPLPGADLTDMFNRVATVDESNAIDGVIAQNALKKVREEAEQERRQNAEERKRQREADIASIMYSAEEQYFLEHKHVMDGRTKRRTKKRIEHDYDKGRYTKRVKSDLNG